MEHAMPSDDHDIAVAKLAQLHALLVSITTDGCDLFEGLSSKLRHDLLWLASGLADEAHRSMIDHLLSEPS